MTVRSRASIVWRSDPASPTGYPMAAVVWMPDGPALATIEISRAGDYLGRIADRLVTGPFGRPIQARRELAKVVTRSHEAAARRAADATR